MEEVQDYYAFLGVSRNATMDEIKKAFARKRRKYQDDEQKTIQLNLIYAVLSDEKERKKYDAEYFHGSRISELKETIKNSNDQEIIRDSFLELKKIYEEILHQNAADLDAMINLCNIAEVFGDQDEVISYLSRIEKCVQDLADTDEALECWKFLAEKYEKYGKFNKAIHSLKHVCQADADDIESITHLARLFYEKEEDLKSALSLLNESMGRTRIDKVKMHYLCESLRAIHTRKKGDIAQTGASLYKKMGSLALGIQNKNDGIEINELADEIFVYMKDFLADHNVSVFYHLKEIYLLCPSTDEKMRQFFDALQRTANAIETGKIPKAVSLLLSDKINSGIMRKIAHYISDDAVGIAASMEYIRKNIPLYLDMIKEERRIAFEKAVEDNLVYSKELYDMKNDGSISMDLKEAFECFIIASIVHDEEIWDKGCGLVDDFLKNPKSKNQENLRKTLQRLELFYPKSYESLSAIFFDGKTTEELFGVSQNDARSDIFISQEQKDPHVKGKWNTKIWIYLGYFLGVLILMEEFGSEDFPLWGIAIILGTFLIAKRKENKYQNEEKKETLFDQVREILSDLAKKKLHGFHMEFKNRESGIGEVRNGETSEQQEEYLEGAAGENISERKSKARKGLKHTLIFVVAALICVAIFRIGSSIKTGIQLKQEEEYAAEHDFLLTNKELEKRDKLDKKYRKKTDVNIHVLQTGQSNIGDFPEEDYVWLMIRDNDQYHASFTLENNFLSYDEQQALFQEIDDLYSGGDTDFEKCEEFYNLAYNSIQKHQKNTAVVPNIMGMTMEEAEAELSRHDLCIEKINEDYSSDYEEGTIMYQDEDEGEKVEKDTTIYVGVSLGDIETIVPNIIGMTMEEAETELARHDLYIKKANEDYSSDYEKGIIMHQDMDEGEKVEKGTTIYADISLGDVKTYEDISIQCFYLQKEAMLHGLTIDDILRCWGIVEDDHVVNEGKNIVRFDALLFGIKGYLECELYVPANTEKIESVYFSWYPYSEVSADVLCGLFISDGYTLKKDGYGVYPADSIVYETGMGKVQIDYSYNVSRVCFSAYY